MIRDYLSAIGILIFIIVLVGISIGSIITPYDDNYCGICEWNYCYSELLDYNDPGSHAGALDEIWNQANYGKQVDIGWYEQYRLKYNISSVPSFYKINYSNPRPSSPDIKYMDEGNISYISFSHDVGYPELIYVNPIINGTKYDWKILEIGDTLPIDWKDGDSFPFDYSHTYFVYKHKDRAWHNSYKDAFIVDGTLNPEHKNNTLNAWKDYYERYAIYLRNGGIDLGDDYWM